MATKGRRKQALRACNYELFQAETLVPPPPATINHQIAEATRQVLPELVTHIDPVRPAPAALPEVEELYRLFDRFNWKYFGGKLPKVKIEYSRRMSCAGSYSPHRRLIRIGWKYHEIFPQDLEDTLKHEMIHIRHFGHDRKFKDEAERIGASLRAREHPALRRKPKFLYECPGCGAEYPRQRRLTMASCAYCSEGRRYDSRFKLRPKKIPLSGSSR